MRLLKLADCKLIISRPEAVNDMYGELTAAGILTHQWDSSSYTDSWVGYRTSCFLSFYPYPEPLCCDLLTVA
jgi:hypothetical protein